jgi:hypothetical protein
MKYQGLLLMIGLFAAGQAAAQQHLTGTSVSKAVTGKHTIHWLAPEPAVKTIYNSRYVGGLNTEAWTTQAGWYAGASAFPDAETYRTGMCLFWIGHEPWQHAMKPVGRQ